MMDNDISSHPYFFSFSDSMEESAIRKHANDKHSNNTVIDRQGFEP